MPWLCGAAQQTDRCQVLPPPSDPTCHIRAQHTALEHDVRPICLCVLMQRLHEPATKTNDQVTTEACWKHRVICGGCAGADAGACTTPSQRYMTGHAGAPDDSLLAINDAGAGREHGREAMQVWLHVACFLHRYPPHVNRTIEVRILMQCSELLDLQQCHWNT